MNSLPSELPGKPKDTEAGSLPLIQGTFPTQELNWGLLHCRWILYQLSHQVSPSIYISPQSRHLVVTSRGLHRLITAFLFNLISYLSHSLFCEGRNSLFVKLTEFFSVPSLFVLTSFPTPGPGLRWCDLCSYKGVHTQSESP